MSVEVDGRACCSTIRGARAGIDVNVAGHCPARILRVAPLSHCERNVKRAHKACSGTDIHIGSSACLPEAFNEAHITDRTIKQHITVDIIGWQIQDPVIEVETALEPPSLQREPTQLL